jgi:hypothetical protein
MDAKEPTKKARILAMFEDAEWIPYTDGKDYKVFPGEAFDKFNLNHNWELGETFNDVIYARRIFQSMGYAVNVGGLIMSVAKQKK